jgi:hypothetical protein
VPHHHTPPASGYEAIQAYLERVYPRPDGAVGTPIEVVRRSHTAGR